VRHEPSPLRGELDPHQPDCGRRAQPTATHGPCQPASFHHYQSVGRTDVQSFHGQYVAAKRRHNPGKIKCARKAVSSAVAAARQPGPGASASAWRQRELNHDTGRRRFPEISL